MTTSPGCTTRGAGASGGALSTGDGSMGASALVGVEDRFGNPGFNYDLPEPAA